MSNEAFVRFDYIALLQAYPPNGGACNIALLTDNQIDYLVSGARLGHFTSTRWFASDGSDLDQGRLSEIDQFVSETERRLIMACDLSETMERIATALETIAAAQQAQTSLDEILEDIENALGTGNLAYQALSGLLGMIPSFRAIPVPQSVIFNWLAESVTWRWPILAQMTIIATALATMAATGLASTFSSFWNTVFAGLGYFNSWGANLKDIMFGDKSVWDAVVWPVVRRVVPTSQGGDAPPGEVDQRVVVQNEIRSIINACCVGIPTFPTAPTDWITSNPQHEAVSASIIPSDFGEGWGPGNQTSQTSKCAAANYMINSCIEFFDRIDEALGIGNVGQYALSHFVGGTMALLVLLAAPVFVPTVALVALATAVLAAAMSATGSYVGNEIADILRERKPCLVAALYNATSVGDARNRVHQELAGISGLYENAILAYLSTSALVGLFWKSGTWPNLSGQPTTNCADCDTESRSITVIVPTGQSQPSYPGGNFISSTGTGGGGGNARIEAGITSPLCQVVTLNSISPGLAYFGITYRAVNGTLVTTPNLTYSDLPYELTVREGSLQTYNLVANFTYASSFQANITATDCEEPA